MNRMRAALVAIAGVALVTCSASCGHTPRGSRTSPAVNIDHPLKRYAALIRSDVSALSLRPAEKTTITVSIQNAGEEVWASAGKFPVTLSYTWTKNGQPLAIDGERTVLPGSVRPHETAAVDATIVAPPAPGKYTLRLSLVQEGVTWFYQAGASTLDLPTTISGQPADNPVTAFHLWFYSQGQKTWDKTYWLGTQIQKNPLDLHIYQEIIYETKPDLLIESGTLRGGSAAFFASIFDLVNNGRVLSIDVVPEPTRPKHKRITYLTGSSTSDDIIRAVRSAIRPGERVMVTLDSLHTRDHVLQELKLYNGLVTVGNYLVVEDSNVNGHPVLPGSGPGPMEAITEFMSGNTQFIQDVGREKFGFTFNPGGWLKKVK